MNNCLQVNVSNSTVNTIKNHYFKLLEKKEIEENVQSNADKLRIEFEKETHQIVENDLIQKYKKTYTTRVSEHAKNGTFILMKKLMNEDFIFKDIINYLEKSHKIKLYLDQLINNFKKNIN